MATTVVTFLVENIAPCIVREVPTLENFLHCSEEKHYIRCYISVAIIRRFHCCVFTELSRVNSNLKDIFLFLNSDSHLPKTFFLLQ